MDKVTVGGLRSFSQAGGAAISAQVTIAGRCSEVYISASEGPLSGRADPFLPLALLPAMKLGAPLHIDAAVSPRLLRHVVQIQDIVNAWSPGFVPVPITAAGASATGVEAAAPAGVAAFFSGGVDSSYTVLKRQAELTHLILVRGFDMRLQNEARWQLITPPLRRAAASLGKTLIEIETNARALLDDYCDWGAHGCGPALAAVALALSPVIQRAYVAASYPYGSHAPAGSTPLLDPRWSSDQVEIVHDGAEANRWQKLESLVASGPALEWLRVCNRNVGSLYNCCRCRKCMETMVYLDAAGVSPPSRTFALPLDLDELARSKIDADDAVFSELLIAAINKLGAPPHVEAAVRTGLPAAPPPASGVAAADAGQVAGLRARLHDAEAQVALLKADISAMQTSPWWRRTERLRAAGRWLRTRGEHMPWNE